jgi:hypothetical protein
MGGTYGTNGRDEKFIHILVGKRGGKRPLGTPWRRWEDKIKTDLRERGWKVVEWMHVAQDSDQ